MDWGNGVCARIQARKNIGPGREPTREEVMAVYDSKEWSTTPEDVIVAFDSGKEVSAVFHSYLYNALISGVENGCVDDEVHWL